MAKIAKKLTDTEIKSTKPAEKEVNLLTAMVCSCESLPWRREGRKIGISDMQCL